MVFDFSYTDIDVPDTGEWFRPRRFTVSELRKNIFHSQKMVQEKGWGAVYLENHDQNRSVNKYIPEKDIGYHSKTMLACLFLFLRGTPFIYQGQEIGMENIRMASLEDYDDIATRGQYERALKAGLQEEEALAVVMARSRDNNRTPMQWNGEKYAGFSEAEKTWISVNPNYKQINVRHQEEEEASVLKFYRGLIGLRRSSRYGRIIVDGIFLPYEVEESAVIAYQRILEAESLLVIHNFRNRESVVKIPEGYREKIAGNYARPCPSEEMYCLKPYECIVLYKEERETAG